MLLHNKKSQYIRTQNWKIDKRGVLNKNGEGGPKIFRKSINEWGLLLGTLEYCKAKFSYLEIITDFLSEVLSFYDDNFGRFKLYSRILISKKLNLDNHSN